jgi:hypothetical protein
MRKTILFLLFSTFILAACQRQNTSPAFIVGDTTTKTLVQTSEGAWQSIKLNGYIENIPSGVSLPWNEVRGLQGDWSFTMNLTIENQDPDMVIQVLIGDSLLYTAPISKVGFSRKLAFFSLKNMKGDPIKIQAISNKSFVAAQLAFIN